MLRKEGSVVIMGRVKVGMVWTRAEDGGIAKLEIHRKECRAGSRWNAVKASVRKKRKTTRRKGGGMVRHKSCS